jgi:hypothetical protein
MQVYFKPLPITGSQVFPEVNHFGMPVCSFVEGRTFYQKYKLIQRKTAREKYILEHARHIIGRTAWDKNLMSLLAPGSAYYHGNEVLRPAFYERTWESPGDSTLRIMSVMNEELYKGLDVIFGQPALWEQV